MSVKPSNDLSIDVDAALASAAPAKAATPEPAVEPDLSSPKFFGGNEDAADDQELPPGTPAEDTESDEADDGEVFEVQAYGKTHKVNLSDKEQLKKLLSAGLGVKQVFSKFAQSKQEIKRLSDELKQASSWREKADLFDKLEAIKDDEGELYRVITGGKSLEDIVEARLAKRKAYETAAPADRVRMEAEERERALVSRIERMEKSAQEKEENATRANQEATDKQAYAQTYPEFQRVFKELGIKDQVQAQETAADLWELGWARIGRLAQQAEQEGKDLDLNPEFVRKQFQAVAKRFGYATKTAAKEEVAKLIDKKSKAATKQAGIAATKNYSPRSYADLEGLSPTKAFEKLFKR